MVASLASPQKLNQTARLLRLRVNRTERELAALELDLNREPISHLKRLITDDEYSLAAHREQKLLRAFFAHDLGSYDASRLCERRSALPLAGAPWRLGPSDPDRRRVHTLSSRTNWQRLEPALTRNAKSPGRCCDRGSPCVGAQSYWNWRSVIR